MDKKTILVIDDEAALNKLMAAQLKRAGYSTVIAFNGKDGIEKLRHVEPDLIVLDIVMPEIDGIEFYNLIREESGLPRYPVLIVTAHEKLEHLFRDLHIEGFIIKPLRGGQLLEEVGAIFDDKNRQDALDAEGDEAGKVRLTIVEDDVEESQMIADVLTREGYLVRQEATGVSGIIGIKENPPDLALFQLGLPDITGDLAILRLKHMAMTSSVNCLLYAKKNYERKQAILSKYGDKTGVLEMVEYDRPVDMVRIVAEALSDIEEEDEYKFVKRPNKSRR